MQEMQDPTLRLWSVETRHDRVLLNLAGAILYQGYSLA